MLITKDRYNLFRKLVKGIIIVLWIALFICPIVTFNWKDVWGSYSFPYFVCYWHGGDDFAPYPLYWFFVILYFIGFFLNFGNIKGDYKKQIINKNLGYVSGLLILLGIIGISFMSITSTIGINDRLSLPPEIIVHTNIGIGMIFAIMMISIIFAETIFLNRVKIMEAEIVKEEPIEVQEREVKEISGKLYCSSCGAEILDKTGDFCSKCGSPLK